MKWIMKVLFGFETGPRPPESKCKWCGKIAPVINGKCAECGANR